MLKKPKPDEVPEESPAPTPQTIAVSVVEDDEWLRQDLARELNLAAGFRCAGSYATAEEALKGLLATHPDVVVMDINLPGLSGIDCMRRLKELQPDMTVLMLTAYEESDLIFSALRAGASGYLLKRSSMAELLEAIGDAHRGGSPMSSSVARRVVQFFAKQGASNSDAEELTRRERETLRLLTQGQPYKEIAESLGVSINTVRMFIRRIYKKMHVHSRGEATARFLRE